MSQIPRHHRQMLLPGIGESGQAAIAATHVLVVGCGALGSVVTDQLARAGVGELTLLDRDVVEATNLQRQTLYIERDVTSGTPKAEAAARRVREIDGSLIVHPVVEHLGTENVIELLRGVDLVIDGLDNFPTRYLLNDACVREGVPWIYGGAVATGGMSMPILPTGRSAASARDAAITWNEDASTPCLRCIFPEAPPPGSTPTCDTAGVLAAAVATVSSHQVAQAIKLMVGAIDALDRDLVSWDLWANTQRRMTLDSARRVDCPCCAQRLFPHLEAASEEQAVTLCGRNAVQIVPGGGSVTLDLAELAQRLQPHGDFLLGNGTLRGTIRGLEGDSGEAVELMIFPDGRAIITGSPEPEFARSTYARFIGQ